MVGAQAVHQLLVGQEALAALAVMPAVFPEIDVALVIDKLQGAADRLQMIGVGRADKTIGRDAELRPQAAEKAAYGIGVFLGGLAGLGRRLGDLVAVLVGAGQEKDVLAAQGMIRFCFPVGFCHPTGFVEIVICES